MAEVKCQGKVIEAREGLLVILVGIGPGEETHETKAHDALPGDYVAIYDDGEVEVRGREPALPPNVKEIAMPMRPAETDADHSSGG